ncbi:TonB-dependent receptor [candidate division KSB1 bacterium]|nr:TonB-dependent receptor [candidate division KSB1 bacterium]
MRQRFTGLIFFTYLGSFLFLNNVFATDYGSIHGRVYLGNENNAEPGANILVLGTSWGTTTNHLGEFSLTRIPPGHYNLKASFIGYESAEQINVEVLPGKNTLIDFHLRSSVIVMDEVVVTGSYVKHLLKDTPVITEVITEQKVADTGGSDLVDVIREQTGIEISYGIGRTQSAQLQGLNDNHVLILVDGERITGKVDGALDLGQIPIDQIKRIETVKGPMSSIYGSDALGGVINIITKSPIRAPLVTASVDMGTNGRQDYRLAMAKKWENIRGQDRSLAIGLSGNWNKYFGVDYELSDNFSELPEYDKKNSSLNLFYRHENHLEFDLKSTFYKDKNEWLAGDKFSLFTDISGNTKLGNTMRMKYSFTPRFAMQASVNYSGNEHTLDEYGASGKLVKSDVSTTSLLNYRFQTTVLPYKSSVLTLGAEQIIDAIESDRIINREKDYTTNVLFFEDEWILSSLTLTLGGRYSDNSVYGSFFAPKVSMLYSLGDNLRLRGGYGRGFRQPSMKELYIDFLSTVGYAVLGAPDLKPEKSNGYNLGVEYEANDVLWLRLNSFYNQVESLIDYYTWGVENGRTIFSYYNIYEAVTKGVEVDATLNLISGVTGEFGYSYTSAKNNNGIDLPYRVPHFFKWKLVYEPNFWGLRGNIRGRWFAEKPVLDDQVNKDIYSADIPINYSYVSSYFLWDLQLSSTIDDRFHVQAGINNLTNKKSYPFGQIKGREFYLSFKVTIN